MAKLAPEMFPPCACCVIPALRSLSRRWPTLAATPTQDVLDAAFKDDEMRALARANPVALTVPYCSRNSMLLPSSLLTHRPTDCDRPRFALPPPERCLMLHCPLQLGCTRCRCHSLCCMVREQPHNRVNTATLNILLSSDRWRGHGDASSCEPRLV